MCYPDIFETVVYPEPEAYLELRHIHNPAIFRTLAAYSKSEAYPEPCHTSAMKC